MRIEHHVKQELSASVEDPSRFSAPLGSLLILKHRVLHPLPDQLTLLLLSSMFDDNKKVFQYFVALDA